MSDLIAPGIMSATGTDGFDLMLRLHTGISVHQINEVSDLRVSVPDVGLPGLEFEISKNNPLINDLRDRFEVSLVVWDRWKSRWVEPPNCRFIITQVSEDPLDLAAKIRFSGTGIGFLLNGVVVHKGRRDNALVAREEAAKQAYESAKSELDSRRRAVISKVREVRNRRKLWGQMWYRNSFPKATKNNSLLWHQSRGQFYRWSTGAKKWVRLNETATVRHGTRDAYTAWRAQQPIHDKALNVYKRARAAAVEATKGGKRPMVSTTAGHVMIRHWAEATARAYRPTSYLTRSFSSGLTSARKKWPLRRDWEIGIGDTLLQVVEMLVDAGAAEYRFRGRVMDMGPPGTFRVNQTGRVHLRYSLDLESGDSKTDYSKHAGYSLIRGDGDKTWGVLNTGSPAPSRWGRWEESISASGAKTRAQARTGTRGHRVVSAKNFLTDDSFALVLQPGRPKPLVDYLPGHMIMVDTPSGAAKMVVREITLARDAEGKLSGSIIVGYARKAAIQLGRNVSKGISGAAAQIGMHGAVPDIDPGWPEQLEVTAPAPPVTDATVAADPVTGRYTVNLSVVWDDEATTETIPEDEENDFVDDVNIEP